MCFFDSCQISQVVPSLVSNHLKIKKETYIEIAHVVSHIYKFTNKV